MSIADLFQKTSPAVVKILVNGESHKGVATGSGFIVAWPTPDSCEVVTNYHVIRPGVGATIEFENGAIADVENVLVENDSADLALLAVRLRSKVSVHPSWPPDVRARMEEEASRESNPPPRRLIDVNAAARPPVGTRVIAIGSPKGMTNTLSDGLISGYRTQDAKKDWIQITNPIGPGSSGGPLLDETGTFVGVTTASFDDAQNLNFAVPASAVRTLLEEKRLPRALWKGSSIDAEERAVYREIFDEAFSKFCGSSDDLKNERERVDDYFNSVNLPPEVLAVGGMDQNRRFQKYWEELARMDDPFALVIRGCYDTNWGGPNWGGPLEKRMRDAIQSLKRTLQKTERFRFFVLYKIGEAEWYLADLTRRQVIPTQPADPKVYAQALEYLRMARTANPDFAPSFNLRAILLTEAGQYSEALTATKELLERVPGSAKAHTQRAELLAATGSTLDAIAAFERARNLDPHEFQAAYRLGQLYSQAGHHEKAIAAYNAAIGIVVPDPKSQPAEPNEAVRQASEAFHRASEAAHMVWQIRRFIGWEYIRLNRFEEALAMFEQALQSPGVDDDPRIRAALQQDVATCLQMRAGK